MVFMLKSMEVAMMIRFVLLPLPLLLEAKRLKRAWVGAAASWAGNSPPTTTMRRSGWRTSGSPGLTGIATPLQPTASTPWRKTPQRTVAPSAVLTWLQPLS